MASAKIIPMAINARRPSTQSHGGPPRQFCSSPDGRFGADSTDGCLRAEKLFFPECDSASLSFIIRLGSDCVEKNSWLARMVVSRIGEPNELAELAQKNHGQGSFRLQWLRQLSRILPLESMVVDRRSPLPVPALAGYKSTAAGAAPLFIAF
jgi:hypothetical protein